MDNIIIMILTVGLTALAFVLSEVVYILSGADLDGEEEDYGLE